MNQLEQSYEYHDRIARAFYRQYEAELQKLNVLKESWLEHQMTINVPAGNVDGPTPYDEELASQEAITEQHANRWRRARNAADVFSAEIERLTYAGEG